MKIPASPWLNGMTPVRPIPTRAVLVALLLAPGLAVAIACGLATGGLGWAARTPWHKVVTFAALAILLVNQARLVACEMEPGQSCPRQLNWNRWLAPAAFLVIAASLFPWSPGQAFLVHGLQCAARATATSVLILGTFWLTLRRGYFLNLQRAGAAVGLLAGLCGFLSQELSCPIPEAAHIAIAHAGLIAASTLSGAAIGSRFQNRSEATGA